MPELDVMPAPRQEPDDSSDNDVVDSSVDTEDDDNQEGCEPSAERQVQSIERQVQVEPHYL